MRVLVIKTSSLGDVIHTLPAITEARQHSDTLTFDWVVEDAFAQIPRWHPAVAEVIPVNLRRWRKHLWHTWRSGEWNCFCEHIRRQHYDHVIDAQGLLKSAFLSRYARGMRSGFDYHSAREAQAAWFYQQRIAVPKKQHAILRLRQLFAAVLGYDSSDDVPDYGLNRYTMTMLVTPQPRLVFLHGTTWPSKHWPEAHWHELAAHAAAQGYHVRLPWGNHAEQQRAQRIARAHARIEVIPASSLAGLASEINMAHAVIGVDTGLMHLAAAQGIPGITIYGATDPGLTGTWGQHQIHLRTPTPCAPCLQRQCHYSDPDYPACYQHISAQTVWDTLRTLLAQIPASTRPFMSTQA
jgi:heptosyltransferase I